jgi:hypothetical protein
MNERIKELYKQAGFTVARGWGLKDTVPEDVFIANVCVSNEMKKFAELIVRECMKESMAEIVADEEIDREKDPLNREYLKGNNQGIVDAVVRFRNHFGVEE